MNEKLVIDCDACVIRSAAACSDCFVTALIGPPDDVGLDVAEVRALHVLADSGLVPPLRLVRSGDLAEPHAEAG